METTVKPTLLRTYLSLAPAKGAGVVAWLVASLAVLISWAAWNDPAGLSRFLDADRAQIFEQHELWRLFTAPWVHASPDHLLNNLPFLFGITFLTSGYFGLLAVPLATIAAGAFIEAFTLYFYPNGVGLVGASGIIYFLGGLWLSMVFVIERDRAPLGRRIVSCVGIALALLAPRDSYEPHVSYAAHAAGFALGPFGAMALYPALRAKIRAAEVWKIPTPPDEIASIA